MSVVLFRTSCAEYELDDESRTFVRRPLETGANMDIDDRVLRVMRLIGWPITPGCFAIIWFSDGHQVRAIQTETIEEAETVG